MRVHADKPRGLLNPHAAKKTFRHVRYVPAEDLRFFIAHFWCVEWDRRRKAPYVQELLPHPSIQLVFEGDESRIAGVVTGRFSRRLEDEGRVFGIEFRPGAFYPFVKIAVSQFTDRVIPAPTVFGIDAQSLARELCLCQGDSEMIQRAERFLRPRLPERDETVTLLNRIVEQVISDREIRKVDDLVHRFKLSKRTLQRLFNRYVGISPKWMIQRYRLHEAVEQLAECETVHWPRLALELGYFDQAHFIKDFKAVVGHSPTEYLKEIYR